MEKRENILCYCENYVWYHQPNCNCPAALFEGDEKRVREEKERLKSVSLINTYNNNSNCHCSCDYNKDYYGGNPDKPLKRKSECTGSTRGDW